MTSWHEFHQYELENGVMGEDQQPKATRQVFIETEGGGGPWAHLGELQPDARFLQRLVGEMVLTELAESDYGRSVDQEITIRFRLKSMMPMEVENLPDM